MTLFFDLLKRVFVVCFKPFRFVAAYDLKKQFKSVGKCTRILKPLRLQGAKNISIGSNVEIHALAWLAALPLTGLKSSELVIDDGCYVGDFCHIWATHSVRLERKVLLANHVYITDNIHGYENVDFPIIEQPVIQKKDVVIGEGCWLGENVCVIGASIGKHCVIGANSVVTRDVPDYCVAVGAPARIIKRYDFTSQTWKKTDSQGNFIRT